jgi:hypothetical protein
VSYENVKEGRKKKIRGGERAGKGQKREEAKCGLGKEGKNDYGGTPNAGK